MRSEAGRGHDPKAICWGGVRRGSEGFGGTRLGELRCTKRCDELLEAAGVVACGSDDGRIRRRIYSRPSKPIRKIRWGRMNFCRSRARPGRTVMTCHIIMRIR